MRIPFVTLVLVLIVQFTGVYGQDARLKGIVFGENNKPLSNVNISWESGGTQSDQSGFYSLSIPSGREVEITFSHIGHKKASVIFSLQAKEELEFNPVLQTAVEQIGSVIISSQNREELRGVVSLSPETIRKIPGANPGVENLLQTLPGVSSNNELSTQYAVRGGNYDENLVYINEIEVYRPFLIRSGQQEGLSFVNTDMVRNVDFSAGGFQARYGDRLSSVLDITYRRPVDFAASLDLSLLGGSISAEGISKDQKFTALAGARYRDNSLLVNAKQTETDFKPRFTDIQSYLSYRFTDKFQLDFLGNLAVNKYDYQPLVRQTNFGTLANPIALVILYEGQEQNRYDTYFGAFKGTYKVSENLNFKLIASAYHTQEQEHYDILARYRLGTPSTAIGNEDLGEVRFTRSIGSQLTHARNDLDALIFNLEHKGQYTRDGAQIDWSLKYTHEDFRDRLNEYEIVDSAGFSLRPPLEDFKNDQPYNPYDAPLVPFTSARAENEVQTNRISGYVQYGRQVDLGSARAWYNLGTRAHIWTVSGRNITPVTQAVFSPRGQFSIKPQWKKDMVFRIAAGFYNQPPFFRELRDSSGVVRPEVKAQQSIHLVTGHEWSFDLWQRPFTLISEGYYKKLDDVNPYTLENVRIRYRARNNAEAFAYGLDLRLMGEFVPGTESWVSIGYLKTEENIDNRGYIPRPTDQRIKLGFLFQDYVPTIPSLKLYLNMVYQSGLPGGSPSYADPYEFQSRLPFYFRSDVGFSYVLTDYLKRRYSTNWLSVFKDLSIGLEIFNVFDRQNTITNTFVRDAATQQQYAVPNFLSPRVFNIRLNARF